MIYFLLGTIVGILYAIITAVVLVYLRVNKINFDQSLSDLESKVDKRRPIFIKKTEKELSMEENIKKNEEAGRGTPLEEII